MKRLKLKSWVVPALYVFSITIIFGSIILIGKMVSTDYEQSAPVNYVPDNIIENDDTPVVEVTNDKITYPYTMDGVKVAKNFYDEKASEEDKVKSIIFYKNTYMENSGVLYTKEDSQFEAVSVLDGNVTSITKDDILGNVVEVTHSTELITIYHCLGEVNVKVGDNVKQNDVIGKSGKVNVDEGYENALLFEVNYQGKVLNPNQFYNMQVSDLIK